MGISALVMLSALVLCQYTQIGIFQFIPVNNPAFGLELVLAVLSLYFQSLSGVLWSSLAH